MQQTSKQVLPVKVQKLQIILLFPTGWRFSRRFSEEFNEFSKFSKFGTMEQVQVTRMITQTNSGLWL